MNQRIAFFAAMVLTALCVTGCSVQKPAEQASNAQTVEISLPAKRYMGMKKAELEPLLGGLTEETYYNGGNLFCFARKDIWFGFGMGIAAFSEVPGDAKCDYILAPLSECASFSQETVDKETLCRSLGFSFEGPYLDELEGGYILSAITEEMLCCVSCDKNGNADVESDYVTYKKIS